jgi:hypothetical protein
MYLARSKAGHDKGDVYVVIREEDNFVFLANGTTKPGSRPKKKKKLHIQPILHFPEEVETLLKEAEEETDDCKLKRIVKLYNRFST